MTSNRGYSEEAPTLIERYETLDFKTVHAELSHLYPQLPSRILDIGAGTGRDAAALAALGHEVWAAEPTSEFREAGQRIHADSIIRWVDDALPHLQRIRSEAVTFDLVLMTAVWMHLDAKERERAMPILRTLVRAGGRIAMTLRHGPVPHGRRMFDVSGEETAELAAKHAFKTLLQRTRNDMTKRPGVTWTCLALEAR